MSDNQNSQDNQGADISNSKRPLEPELLRALEVLDRLPKTKESEPEANDILPEYLRCPGCTELVSIDSTRQVNTGVIRIMDCVCTSCRKGLTGKSRIACVTCRQLVGFLDPHKDKTGFEFKPDKYYHVRNCPSCAKDIDKAQIVEKIIYYQKNNIPYEL